MEGRKERQKEKGSAGEMRERSTRVIIIRQGQRVLQVQVRCHIGGNRQEVCSQIDLACLPFGSLLPSLLHLLLHSTPEPLPSLARAHRLPQRGVTAEVPVSR